MGSAHPHYPSSDHSHMARLIHLLACLAALTPALSGPFSSPGRELLAASDKELHAGGIWAKVIGQSGKIDLAPSQDVSSDPNKIRVQIEALRQKDSAGNVLGSGGNAKHSFNSFATQDFAFGALEDTSYGGVTCVKLPFTATLAPGSKIEIQVFLFKENGTITVGADKFAVTSSTMKFNVLLSNWVWCSNNGVCKGTDGVGASVELDFSVTSKEAAKKSPNATGLVDSNAGRRPDPHRHRQDFQVHAQVPEVQQHRSVRPRHHLRHLFLQRGDASGSGRNACGVQPCDARGRRIQRKNQD